MSYDSWDFEPAPASEQPDTWDTWDTGSSAVPSLDLPPPNNNFGKGGFNDGKGSFGGGFNNKGNFGCFDGGCKGDFGKGPSGKDFGKGMDFGKGGFDGMNFGSGPGDFGQGPPDFGKGPPDFGKGGLDFGKGPMDFGKGLPDFGKGSMDFDMGKGGGCDFSKGCGKDFSKGMFDGSKGKDNFSLKGAFGKDLLPPMNKGSFDGKGMMPPGAAPKGQPSGQLIPPPGVVPPPHKGFDGGKGFMPMGGPQSFGPGLKGGPPGPGFQPMGGAPPPPPPGGVLPPFPNGNLAPFAKMPQFAPGGLAPELLALTEAENVTFVDDLSSGLKALPVVDVRKPRLILLLTRLAPDLQSEHMQQILDQCGEVQAFRRARDPSGKPLSFGFAQFADPEAAWKASTCISKLVLCGTEIKVLQEEQTESIIDQWRKTQQAALKVASNEETEWELERKSVSCKSAVDAKVEEIYGTSKGGAAASKRRQELRQKEQARILRVRKRKAWREAEFAKELERVESMEKRMRREEKARDGMDRKREELQKPKETKDESDLKGAKREDFGDSTGPLESVGTLAVVSNDSRVLCDLVDRINSEPRDVIFKMGLDVTHLRNEKTFEKKLRPWLERKVELYMGGPQCDLVEYILRRVNGIITPNSLISDLSRYLDDNAEALVERMWRMLVFEHKRCGHPMGGYADEKN